MAELPFPNWQVKKKKTAVSEQNQYSTKGKTRSLEPVSLWSCYKIKENVQLQARVFCL